MDTIYSKVKIESWGYEMPEETLSSSDIEKLLSPVYERLKLPEGRLELMSGIKERRIWRKGTRPSDAAYLAGRNAISRSALDIRDIGCLINCSVCRDCLEPATATIVHDKLKLSEDCLVFDISNACLGILTGMLIVSTMIENGQIKAGMLVAGENSRSLIESTIAEMNGNLSLTRKSIKSYFSSLTIGSGAIAMILCRSDIGGGDKPLLKGGSTLAVTRHNSLCQGNEDKSMEDNLDTLMNTDSERLMHEGVSVAKQTWELFKNATGWDEETADIICTHQVGVAHKKLLFETLGLKLEKDFSTLEKLGNTGSVSCPLTFAIAADSGRFKNGMKAALLGIGSGINCTMLGVEWL